MTSIVNPVNSKSLTWFIDRVIPSYIIEQFSGVTGQPSFPLFMEKFFEFIGQNYIDTVFDSKGNIVSQTVTAQGAYLIIQNLVSYADIDQTLTGFLQYFKNEYAASFPFIGDFDNKAGSISTDLRRLIKKIREFYISKGSINSLKFFFRAGFDQEIDLYFPSIDMLRVSDGKWFQPYYLGPLNINDTEMTFDQLELLLDRSLVGQSSAATGYVEGIEFEAITNAIVTADRQYWVSLGTHKGTFIDGEQVKAYDSITGQLIYTFKLRDRHYDLVDNTFPDLPYIYKGRWKNGTDYHVGDVVGVLPEDTLAGGSGPVAWYVATEDFTSVSYPEWTENTFYNRSSIVLYNPGSGVVPYVATVGVTKRHSNTTPDLDPTSWNPLGIQATHDFSIWSNATIYDDGALVSYLGGDSIWRGFQLEYFRTQFKSDYTPAVDTIAWSLSVGDSAGDYTIIPPGTQFNFVAGTVYNVASVVVDPEHRVWVAKSFREHYNSPINPADPAVANIVWVRTSSEGSSDFPTHPNWDSASFYSYGDIVNFEDPVLGWGLYQLIKPLEATFLSNIAPALEPLRWEIYAAGNLKFDQEPRGAITWKLLPDGVDPEAIGVSPNDFPGRWINHDGWLDSEKKIQDSFFYQDYSYQISANLDKSAFQEALINTTHPAGFQLFNVVTNVDLLTPFSLELTLFQPDINFVILGMFSLPFWDEDIWYKGGQLVHFEFPGNIDQIYRANGSSPFNSSTSPNLDTTNWTNVTSTKTFNWIFKPEIGDPDSFLVLERPVIPNVSFEMDYSTFEMNRCFNLTFDEEIIDNIPMNYFEIYAGSNNVLFFVGGKKIAGVQKKSFLLPGQSRYPA